MKNIYICSVLAATSLLFGCSDISETQKEYTDQGETSYVGKLDEVVAYGGINRVLITGKNTYLRNATECYVTWTTLTGEDEERSFDLVGNIDGEYTNIEITNLDEGSYQFYVQTADDSGNRSLKVECAGSVYGPEYAESQLGIVSTAITKNDDGSATVSISQVSDVVGLKVGYYDNDSQFQEEYFESVSGSVTIPSWRGAEAEEIELTTYIIPEAMAGIDVLELETKHQSILRGLSTFDTDKTLMSVTTLTAHDDSGYDIDFGGGGGGAGALIDGNNDTEMWSETVPTHFGFDLGEQLNLTEVSIVGRKDYCGWDLVKFEIWGRENLDDGPDGDTGYSIQSKSVDDGFEAEAIQRGWTCVGKGWFTYNLGGKSTPTNSTAKLTEVDESIKPRYILFRMMSILTPDGYPSLDDYDGSDGGYYLNDGYNNDTRRTANVGELYFKAQDYLYNIQ